jgi:VanZ family protein
VAASRRLLWTWLPVLAWAGVIFALSSIPGLGTGLGYWDLVLRKLAHLAEFAILGALLARALPELHAFLAGIGYAAFDEIHQHFVPGRAGTLRDVAIDSVGVLLGVLAWRRWGERRGSSAPA